MTSSNILVNEINKFFDEIESYFDQIELKDKEDILNQFTDFAYRSGKYLKSAIIMQSKLSKDNKLFKIYEEYIKVLKQLYDDFSNITISKILKDYGFNFSQLTTINKRSE